MGKKLWLPTVAVSMILFMSSIAHLRDDAALAVCLAWISGGLFSFSGGLRRAERKVS
jgi:hypothetical protein